MVLFAIGERRGPRGFAFKFKNRESYVEEQMTSQNLDLRLSLLLAVSFAVLRAPIWEPFLVPDGSIFAFRVLRGPRGFAFKFKNSES